MTLTTNVNPSGNGTVRANPAPNCVTDNTKYSRGTRVVLVASPAAGKSFVNWSGQATGTNPVRPVIMHGNRNVTANFSP
jgi:uncharacterized repeat protein (TIGR02543 family)